MNTTTRTPSSPESYATFWEPLVADGAPVAVAQAPEPVKAQDAYLEFTEITEGVPAAVRVRR
ncbi:hypothetical protein [Frigoriglobus tundricola]|uniref:Uncharacterized protein n=1 Tax=Frigoriglobus tundricola TaxID=2774151 RepID=A0A6M5YLP9_9BACT|nr:hypothetical protein [Frigoriglobus tundricola]QJW94845.1 hypothetical protein FTUN_2371 [Frigoriglobus tundricola]